MYDVQAAYMISAFAAAGWTPAPGEAPAPPPPPPFPHLTVSALPLVVNATGFTVPAPGLGRTVYAATAFPNGMQVDVDAVGTAVLGSIVAAGAGGAGWI